MHFLLGISYDAGYVPFLQRFAADRLQWDRITLLQGYQVSPAMAKLDFRRRLKLSSVFVQAAFPTVSQTPSASEPEFIDLLVEGGQMEKSSKLIEIDCVEEMLGPILTNDNGVRYDKPVHVSKNLVEFIQLRTGVHGCSLEAFAMDVVTKFINL